MTSHRPADPYRALPHGLRGALLVTGTTSDAGKSTLVTGLCRWLHRHGVRVAPFKAQNMSNNSAVTPEGGEIGRAQALQAAACGLAPSVRFNPVLLKPGSQASSQVVLLGHPVGSTGARDYRQIRAELVDTVLDTLTQLRAEYDVVICEGAGSPAEINLRAGDMVNMGLARAARLPTLLVGDIDRGGVFAAMYGTLALLSPADQALLAGFVVNKFRGDPGLLAPGLTMLSELTGRPVHGVLPFQQDLWLDSEDSLGYTDGRLLGRPAPPYGGESLRVAVIRLPHISNATDLEALAAEPGLRVRLTTSPAELAEADLVVLPGSRATVADLEWLRHWGLADAVYTHVAAGRPLLGICGGYQMLAESIEDTVESRRGVVRGLGLLPSTVVFATDKTLARPTGSALGAPVGGYEIHHGTATVRYQEIGGSDAAQEQRAEPFVILPDGSGEGCRLGPVFGTHWHGVFEHDEFRRRFLTEVARLAGRNGFRAAPDTSVTRIRETALDRLADLVEEHLDTAALLRLIDSGAPPDLPFVPPGAPTPRSAPDRSIVESLRLLIERGPTVVDPAPRIGPPAPHSPEVLVPGRRTVESFRSLADRVLGAPAGLGEVRLVAVDGRAGSGKTTFAGRLVAQLTARGAATALLHTDDLLQGWLDMVTFWPRLEEWVLAPLRRGEPARYRRFDWEAGQFRGDWESLGRPDVLVLEGVTAARSIIRPESTFSVCLQVDRETRFARGVRRDGAGVVDDWNRWMLDEDQHFAADRTAARVDVLVDGDPCTPHRPDEQYVRIIP